MAHGALRRENRTPDDVIIRRSAAAADQHFKVLIVIEPNLDRVWAALMAGAQPGRTAFTVVQLATSGLDDAPKVRSVILRSADAERGAVWHCHAALGLRSDPWPNNRADEENQL